MPASEEILNSIRPVVNNTKISLYPNPATDFFRISGLEDTALITISDMYCRVLLTTKISNDENIPVTSLRKGVYIAKITTSTATVERKLVKH